MVLLNIRYSMTGTKNTETQTTNKQQTRDFGGQVVRALAFHL